MNYQDLAYQIDVHMKEQVELVLAGKEKSVEVHARPRHIMDYLGTKPDWADEVETDYSETNGWQCDFWFPVEDKNGNRYRIDGDNVGYELVTFLKIEEEDE